MFYELFNTVLLFGYGLPVCVLLSLRALIHVVTAVIQMHRVMIVLYYYVLLLVNLLQMVERTNTPLIP